MLEFEHSIRVNDPETPDTPCLSREQLWQGLVFRCQYPGHFNPALSCHIEEHSAAGFIRTLQFGASSLRDRVMLITEREIHTRPAEPNPALYAESITRIEEPEPGHLLVRFSYRRDSGNSPGSIDVDEYLKAAYVQNDQAAIALLRQFIVEGWPESDT